MTFRWWRRPRHSGTLSMPATRRRASRMAGWLVLVYRLPPIPSAPRVAVWRALQKLPGGYLQDGTYAAPHAVETDVQLRILVHDIRNQGGQASLLRAEWVDDPRHLKSRL